MDEIKFLDPKFFSNKIADFLYYKTHSNVYKIFKRCHNLNPSSQEAETGTSLWVQGQHDLYSEFQATQDYIVRPS